MILRTEDISNHDASKNDALLPKKSSAPTESTPRKNAGSRRKMRGVADRFANESAIRWRFSAVHLPYIRETLMLCRYRRGPVKIPGGRVMGWAELAPGRHFNRFVFRRVWWLKTGSDPYPGRWCPAEAVAPASIAPGVPSRRLDRQEVVHAG